MSFNLSIDPALATEEEYGGGGFTAIQATRYQHTPVEDESIVDETSGNFVQDIDGTWYRKPTLSISDTDYDNLSVAVKATVPFVKGTYKFGKNKSDLYSFPAAARFCILSRPLMFTYDKKTGVVYPNQEVKKGSGIFTISRVLVAIIYNEQFIVDDSGSVKIFGLKLRSTNTKMVKAAGQTTIYSLNEELQKQFKVSKRWLMSQVTAKIDCTVETFTNMAGEASTATKFFIEPELEGLSEPNRVLISQLTQDPDFQAVAKDPFGLERGSNSESESNTAPSKPKTAESFDDIPF